MRCVFSKRLSFIQLCKKAPWLQEKNHVKLLPWLGNLLDMNTITSLWAVLKDKPYEIPITDKILLIKRRTHVWLRSKKIKDLGAFFIKLACLEELLH